MDSPARRRIPSSTSARSAILAAIISSQGLSFTANAADLEEFWPELSAFYQLNPSARVYVDGSYSKGKESDQLSLDAAAYLDVSLKPFLRTELQSEDWQRNRYLWSRIGYTRVFDVEGGGSREVKEDRGVVALYGRAPLRDVVLEARARVDLRWIGGDYSNRYRIRIDASREFELLAHTVVPYLNAEWFYDTRYDAWARTLFQGGVEVTETKRFRYEIYLARQNDHKPSDKTLNALGVVLKWYF